MNDLLPTVPTVTQLPVVLYRTISRDLTASAVVE